MTTLFHIFVTINNELFSLKMFFCDTRTLDYKHAALDDDSYRSTDKFAGIKYYIHCHESFYQQKERSCICLGCHGFR